MSWAFLKVSQALYKIYRKLFYLYKEKFLYFVTATQKNVIAIQKNVHGHFFWSKMVMATFFCHGQLFLNCHGHSKLSRGKYHGKDTSAQSRCIKIHIDRNTDNRCRILAVVGQETSEQPRQKLESQRNKTATLVAPSIKLLLPFIFHKFNVCKRKSNSKFTTCSILNLIDNFTYPERNFVSVLVMLYIRIGSWKDLLS